MKKKEKSSKGIRVHSEAYSRLEAYAAARMPKTQMIDVLDDVISTYLGDRKDYVYVPPECRNEVLWLIAYFSEKQTPEGERLKDIIRAWASKGIQVARSD